MQKFEIIGIILFVVISAIVFFSWDDNPPQQNLNEVMTVEKIAQFEKTYGWTPPVGFTQAQLIQFMNDNPNASPEELEAGAKEAQNQQSNSYISEVGFSFTYPGDMFVVDSSKVAYAMDGSVDSGDNYRIFVVPNSYVDNEGHNLTAVVISVSLNQSPEMPLDWLKGPWSGANMSDGYSELDIDGQKAISMNGDNWVVFDTPDNKYQISIATLPGRNPSWSLQNTMRRIVESIGFDKNKFVPVSE